MSAAVLALVEHADNELGSAYVTVAVLPPPDGVGACVQAGHILHMEAASDMVHALRAVL